MINRPRGTRDLYPEEMEIRHRVEETLRETVESYGFREILTPTFEHLELFLEKSGEEIVEEIYDFKDKGGRALALRPEFTASVMRMYHEGMRELPKPLKLYYFGPVFRYERPQAGRYREFWHFGTEIIGPDTPEADAENIVLAKECIDRFGLQNYEIKISDLRILSKFLEERGIDEQEKIRSYFHKIDKGEIDEISGELDQGKELKSFLKSNIDQMRTYLDDPSHIAHLETVIEILSDYGIDLDKDYSIKLDTVRGLDYYSGVVFEIDAENLGAEKQICGGGDYRLGDIFGNDVSSKGFALGFDRILLALEKENILPSIDEKKYFIIPIGEKNVRNYSIKILSSLRKNNICADIDMMNRSVGKALSYADRAGFSHAILLGDSEMNTDSITIKDLKKGEQKNMKRSDFIDDGEVK